MKKLLVIILLFTFGTTYADTNGGFAGAFARMGAGARARAMGGAYTGLAEGPAAIYYNPGALPFLPKREFMAMTSKMALDRRLDYLAFATSVHPHAGPEKRAVNAGVGLAWLHGGVGNIDSRDFDGNPLDKIDMSSNLFLFGFGIQFHERFGAGLTAKVVYETFGSIGTENHSVNGDGFGVDFGAFAKPMDHLTVGAQIKDIGAKTTWNTTYYWSQGSSKPDEWPAQYRVGAAYNWKYLTGALDVESSRKGETKLHAGVEGTYGFTAHQSIAGRAGYDGGPITMGIGIGLDVWKVRSTIDFTYVLENIAPDDAFLIGWGVQF
jgi:hypothetical protein